ncbi:MAG: 16S rRNA (cytidine(1402)-2'-O)-methyltransferase [Puniceicoccales bacterium]|jgi:16S rRNA (cytidine1402-2'-O)-methyltransferase|nr:16S rRNA (cytidine(1402)-2'-O)-methyltransferase [Puniceicoccales bacterium]
MEKAEKFHNEVVTMQVDAGLYLIATPIGNTNDITPRALHVLIRVDAVACEDTRVTGGLFKHFSIKQSLFPYHEHNEKVMAITIADRIAAGDAIALVCDAGTPGINDPGFRVVRECRRRKLPVTIIPGPSAPAAAVAASGLPSDAFLYLGFPPGRSVARRCLFEKYRDFPHTLIFLESCHRIQKCIGDIVEIFGEERTVAVVRELTKLHETWHVGSAKSVCEELYAVNARGEYTLIIAAADFTL